MEKLERVYYLSNTTQLASVLLASPETAPHGDPETIFILTFICEMNGSGNTLKSYKRP